MPAPMQFRVLDNIGGGPDGTLSHRKGDLCTRAQLAGCDIAWLLERGKLELIGGKLSDSLMPDNPDQAQLIAEVHRLQGIIEDMSGTLDSAQKELADARELLSKRPERYGQTGPTPAPTGPEVPTDLHQQLAYWKQTAEANARDRDAARARADAYNVFLIEKGHHPPPGAPVGKLHPDDSLTIASVVQDRPEKPAPPPGAPGAPVGFPNTPDHPPKGT